MNRRIRLRLLLGVILAVACGLIVGRGTSARAGVPETFRQIWDRAFPQIDANIERYRKADATLQVVGTDGQPIKGATLQIQHTTHEFLFGCNLFVLGQLDTAELNRKYEEAFVKVFNCATVPFYWRDFEPQEGKPRFVDDGPRVWRRPPTDPLVAWCKAHGIVPKGHALMYSKTMFMPDWIDRNDPKRLASLAKKHMAELAEHYGSEIPLWDVVNEEIPRLANPQEWHAVPDDYLAWCFQEAGRVFPKDVRLLINDGTSQTHVTTSLYEGMIKGLLERGVRVEGIGLQFHAYNRSAMLAGKEYTPSQLTAVYERLGRLGLPLYITEITIPGTGDNGPELQGAVVANLYRLWFSTPAMAGVTWWNLGDGTAFGNENNALGGLLDKDMNPKPAYQALDRLINHDWKTNLTAKTDAHGKAHFRGFHGKYTVQVTAGNQTRQFEITLSRTGQDQHTLTWRD